MVAAERRVYSGDFGIKISVLLLLVLGHYLPPKINHIPNETINTTVKIITATQLQTAITCTLLEPKTECNRLSK